MAFPGANPGDDLLFHKSQQYIAQQRIYLGLGNDDDGSRCAEPGAQPNILQEPSMNDARLTGYAALLLRVTLGTLFVAHALLKYFVFTLPGTAQFFASLGLPGALGYVTFAAELVGGLMLIAGVKVRAVSLALVPVLLGATWAHAGNGWVFSAPNGGWEYPAFWTVMLVVQALLGAGAFAANPVRPAPAFLRA
jgi:putative oxidoreductase